MEFLIGFGIVLFLAFIVYILTDDDDSSGPFDGFF